MPHSGLVLLGSLESTLLPRGGLTSQIIHNMLLYIEIMMGQSLCHWRVCTHRRWPSRMHTTR